jgi:3',5'-cyclic AMP phosphodiesterase CpdA
MPEAGRQIGRRAFLHRGVLLLLGGASLDACAHLAAGAPGPRIGLITDLHYADKEPAGTRHYRETIPKLAEAAAKFRAERPDFVVVLGDLIDAATSVEEEWGYLERIQRELSASLPFPRHFVLGNHCVDTLTKAEFLGGVGQKHSFYAFDAGGHHFVVLDACFRADGVPYQRKNFDWKDTFVPEWELDWLAEDLSRTSLPTIVFAHQRLDLGNEYAAKNAPRVREILERSGSVLAVFQGHSHKNDYREIEGIHYTTLVAMVEGSGEENNGYSMLEVLPGGTLRLTGFRKQQSYQL